MTDLAQYIGCEQVRIEDFPVNGQVGVCAVWPDVRKAVRVTTTGDYEADLRTAADQLIEWRKAQA